MEQNNQSVLDSTLTQQLGLIHESKSKISLLILATLLSYYSVDIQGKQLLCTATDPELCDCLPPTLPIQAMSSILVIYSLVYFTNLSKKTLCEEVETPRMRKKNELNHFANILVLIAAMIRFALLVQDDTTLDEKNMLSDMQLQNND